jgi:hypothetical protein
MDAFGENFAENDQEKNSNPDQKEKNDWNKEATCVSNR